MLIDLTTLPWTLIGWSPNTPAWLRSGGQDPTRARWRLSQVPVHAPSCRPAQLRGSVQGGISCGRPAA